MKQEQLDFILSQGYKKYPTYLPTFSIREHKLFAKQVPTTILCSCNEKEPQFIINYTCCSIHNKNAEVFSICIRASNKLGTWYSLEAYSLSFEELVDRLSRIEIELLQAWEPLA